MGVDSQILGNHQPPRQLEHDGKSYAFRLIDQAAKGEWEQRLYQRAVSAVEALASLRPAAWLEDKLVELNDAFVAGDFSLFSETSRALLGTPTGAGLLLAILTGKELDHLAAILLAKPVEVKALLRVIFKESFPGIPLKFGDESGGEGDEKN